MPHDVSLIATIAAGFALALVFGFIAARLRMPPLVGYPGKLSQVFVNLFINAAQAMSNRPRDENMVRVTTRFDDGVHHVEVEDNARGMTPEDLFRIKFIDDVQIAPSRESAVFVVTTMDAEEDEYRAAIWSVDVGANQARRLTNGPRRDTQPRISPDGRSLAFVRDPRSKDNRDARPQLWILPLDGGDAFRDLLAVIEHEHAVAEAHHELHVVLDQQDRRAVAADPLEQRAQPGGFGGVHAGGGLVEREQPRVGRERARDLELALVAVGEMLREVVGSARDADVFEQCIAPCFDRALFLPRMGVAQDRAEHGRFRAHVAADHHVFER